MSSIMVDMNTLGSRLRAERLAQRKTQGQVGKVGGVSKQAVAKIESGDTKEPATSTMEPIARDLGLNLRWLATGRGSKYAAPDDSGDWPPVLAYRQAAALGDGAAPDEYAETHSLKFRAESLRKKGLRSDRLGIVYGRGESMLPRIKSGDAILFDSSDTDPKDGALFVVTYGGHLMTKQLSMLGGRWFMESLNKDDPRWRKPEPIDEHNGLQIHGRVRWIGSWED